MDRRHSADKSAKSEGSEGDRMTLLWKPLLSATVPMDPVTEDFDYSKVLLPCYASPKLDGYRAMVQRGMLVSRNGLLVANRELQARYGRKEYEGLDGELCDGPVTAANVFNRTSRVVRKAEVDASQIMLYVIDRHGIDMDMPQRLSLISHASSKLRLAPGVVIIKQTLIKSVEQLKAYVTKNEAAGYEGTMLRRADQGMYPQKSGKENRSTLNEFDLARLKRFDYAEATILSIRLLEHNENTAITGAGRKSSKKSGIRVDAKLIGSATLRDVKTGVEFNTNVNGDALRAWPGWQKPELWKNVPVRYKWQVCGTKDKPRINSCSFDELGV